MSIGTTGGKGRYGDENQMDSFIFYNTPEFLIRSRRYSQRLIKKIDEGLIKRGYTKEDQDNILREIEVRENPNNDC